MQVGFALARIERGIRNPTTNFKLLDPPRFNAWQELDRRPKTANNLETVFCSDDDNSQKMKRVVHRRVRLKNVLIE